MDSWLAKWDPDFSARLADAGFVGLTIPDRVRRTRTRTPASLCGDRGTAGARRARRRALDRRPPGGARPSRLRQRGAAAAAAAPHRRGHVVLGDRDERARRGVRPRRCPDARGRDRRRLAAQRHQGVDQRRARRAPDRRAGPNQPARSAAPPRRLQPVHRADRLRGDHDQPDPADERRTPLQRGGVRRRLRRRRTTCSARSATAGIRSPPSWASNAVGRNGFCPPRRWSSPPSGHSPSRTSTTGRPPRWAT